MVFPVSLSALTSFSEFNLVFDGIVLFFTIIYLFVGIKRGMKKSFLCLFFTLVSIFLASLICKLVYPMFKSSIPVLFVHMLPSLGLAFFLTAMFILIVEAVLWLIVFGILKGIFNKILVLIEDYEYTHNKTKNSFGRLLAGVLTAGLAFMLSSGAIAATNGVASYTLFDDYRGEMNQSLVAKYGEKSAMDLYEIMVMTNSIPNQHDSALEAITDGKYEYKDMESYRESIYRLMVVHDVETYLYALDFEENPEVALSRFSQDLCVWASLAENEDTNVFGTKDMLNNFLLPIVTEIAKTEVNTENVYVFPYTNHSSTFSKEVNDLIVQIF